MHMEIYELQGSEIVDTPRKPGVYAWYFRPQAFEMSQVRTLAKLIASPSSIKTEISLRYKVMWSASTKAQTLYGKERQPVNKAVIDLVDEGGDLTKSFIQTLMVPYFAKPLYIGISDNLFTRVNFHYESLIQLWDSDEPISRYLDVNPKADVQEVLDNLGLDHSFAINARVKGISPRDLFVCVCALENPEQLKDLEDILQILADPICGRE